MRQCAHAMHHTSSTLARTVLKAGRSNQKYSRSHHPPLGRCEELVYTFRSPLDSTLIHKVEAQLVARLIQLGGVEAEA